MSTGRRFLIASLTFAACTQPRTEIVVSVDSELEWGTARTLQSVVVSVRRGSASGPLRDQRTSVLGVDSGRRTLPFLVGVTPDAADDVDTPLWIEVLGCAAPGSCDATNAVVAQRAVVRFQRGRTLGLPMLLAAACRGAPCDVTERCEPGTGMCRPAAEAEASIVPFDPNAAASDSGIDRLRAFDSTMDAAVSDVTADAPDATFAPTDTQTPADVQGGGPDVVAMPDVSVVADVQDSGIDAPVVPDVPAVPDVPSVIDVGVDAPRTTASPPRPIAPTSTSIVTSRRPNLHWALASGTDGARVQICRDRACTMEITAFDAAGTSAVPASDLPPGVVFWRLFGRSSGGTGTNASPTWQFTVGARSATAANTSSDTVLDVNGDGLADLAVGAYGASSSAGRVYVHRGSAGGVVSTATSTFRGGMAGGYFGGGLASAGDVNGDGFSDLIVGAQLEDDSDGAAYLYLGGTGGLPAVASARLAPPALHAYFGSRVTSAGDVNGDGYGDVLISAHGVGQVHLYLGGASGLPATPSSTLADGGSVVVFARATASGDVNGDGFSDVVVQGNATPPRIYIFHGGAVGLPANASRVLPTPETGFSSFGASITAGDVNGDGYADVLVGSPSTNDYTGAAYLYLGGAAGLATTPALSLTGPDGRRGYFGNTLLLSDLNDDGYADIVVGANQFGDATGRVYIYRGGSGALATIPDIVLLSPDGEGSQFGVAAHAADFDGDGHADLVIGALQFGNLTGRVYVYRGRVGGIPTTPTLTLDAPDGVGSHFGYPVVRADEVLPSGIGAGAHGAASPT